MHAYSNRCFPFSICLRFLVAAGLLLTFVLPGFGQATERISISPNRLRGRLPGNGYSSNPGISADGRYVAFASYVSNLVPNDTNFVLDAFVLDRQTGTFTHVTTAADGTQHNGQYCIVAISANGRYVAFSCDATNLVPGDTNATYDVFVKDRLTGALERVSTTSDGTQSNAGCSSSSYSLSLSADGRRVMFASLASNLVPGDTNGFDALSGYDLFVKDRVTDMPPKI